MTRNLAEELESFHRDTVKDILRGHFGEDLKAELFLQGYAGCQPGENPEGRQISALCNLDRKETRRLLEEYARMYFSP